MKDLFKRRQLIIGLVFLIMCGALAMMLGEITLAAGEEFTEKADNRRQRVISVNGQRGRILDRNGIPLAINQKSYDVEFYRDPDRRNETDRALDTETVIKTVELIENCGGKTIDTFVIRKDADGTLGFHWGVTSEMAVAQREQNWADAMGFPVARIREEDGAAYAYASLRGTWQIPEEMPYGQARKVMSVWQEVAMNQWRSYIPVKIAYNVSMETVAQIEQRSEELTGMAIVDSTVRVYPKGSSAAHIVGYLRRMDTLDPEAVQEKEEAGYAYDDLLGAVGIEASMEEYLTGNTTEHKGGTVVEVNTNTKITRVLEATEPTNGHDILLTIDMGYQQKLEEALAATVESIRKAQQTKLDLDWTSVYSTKREDRESIQLVTMGAAIVMDIHTGEVLAMANYPSYDANIFTGGISDEQYKALSTDPAAPLFNKAIASKAMPGSIFKMATAYAGLAEGVITVDTTIDDQSPYTAGGLISKNAPSCWVTNPADHSDQNVVRALSNSCNYFFFSVADRLGIQKLDHWAGRLGLSSLTNIELPGELAGQIGGQKVLYDNTRAYDTQRTPLPRLVYNQIFNKLKEYVEQLPNWDAERDEPKVGVCAKRLMELVDDNLVLENDLGPVIRRIMREELGISETMSNNRGYHQVMVNSLLQLRWNISQTVRTGIGQGVSLVTPISVARYVSALINGGTVYDARIVKSVVSQDGSVILEKPPAVFSKLEEDPDYLAKIKEGMKGVISHDGINAGTAESAFKDYPEKYRSEIGCKTGTAQISVSKEQNVDIENTSWFVAFTPYEKPEIAIVAYVPHGLSGSSSAPLVQEMVRYHIDRKNSVAPENLVAVDGLTR